MMAGYTVDLTSTVEWICRTRNFILYTSRTITLWLIAFATIDRWLSTCINANRRQISTLKNTRRCIIVILIFSILLNIPILCCYQANLTGALRGCYGSTYICRVVTDVIYAVITTLFPLCLMIGFGIMIIQNTRYTRNRIQAIPMVSMSIEPPRTFTNLTRDQQQAKRKINRHLLKMLSVQVTLFIILTCPHAIQKAYTSISASTSTQSIQSAIENFIFNFVTLMNFTASGISFYIYTLSGGSLFRNALFQLVKGIQLKVLCR
ncbi:unnamed protein product [Adineta ricciae]|uniref:G-protein coupled receptors family 1 profile domain-containing protein n=1 Tax=Adineta ricciae TaxID=249248 RepID=A0A815PV90_ADIRI|nr:unnamed protein product [Adineta ricciae]CAF1453774.1 unnamed protein product [Adineta ricciae]